MSFISRFISGDVAMPTFGELIGEMFRENVTLFIVAFVIELLAVAVVAAIIISRNKNKKSQDNVQTEKTDDDKDNT